MTRRSTNIDGKIIFRDRTYQCIAVDTQRYPDSAPGAVGDQIPTNMPWAHFAPFRWRYVCTECAIVASPLGYYEGHDPHQVPVRIKKKVDWRETTRPVCLGEDEDHSTLNSTDVKTDATGGAEEVLFSEYFSVLGILICRYPRLSVSELCDLLEAVRYEANYADGGRDYFFGVEVCTLTSDEQNLGRVRESVAAMNAERLAEAQRMLSSGLMLTQGPLVEEMNSDECLLYNYLVARDPSQKSRPLSYRDIAPRLGVSHMTVKRMHGDLVKKYGERIGRLIAEARQVNSKKIDPRHCDSGRKIKTAPPPESPSPSL